MSEASPATHMCPTERLKYGSIGVPLPNTESQVIKDGHTYAASSPGLSNMP